MTWKETVSKLDSTSPCGVHFHPIFNFFFKMTALKRPTFWYPPLVSTPLSSPRKGGNRLRGWRQTGNTYVEKLDKTGLREDD